MNHRFSDRIILIVVLVLVFAYGQQPQSPVTVNAQAGDITAVNAGYGLSGGGNSGAVTLSANLFNTSWSGSGQYGFQVENSSNNAIVGKSSSPYDSGVYGLNTGGGFGVGGRSTSGTGVYGESATGYAGEFRGDMVTHGAIRTIYGGAALRAVPIAYGTFNSNGTRYTGTPNLSCRWPNSSDGLYICKIDGEQYALETFTTLVTPATFVGGSVLPKPLIPVVATAPQLPGEFLVLLFTISGSREPSQFQLVIFKT